jgi:ACS family tartrate transporter-like MFS transporter
MSDADAAAVDPRVVRRKVAWRIVPQVFVLYIVAYLDRTNISFAKLQMQSVLGFSDEIFGYGFAIFFVGYLLLEIPGALLVEHWSARKWFTRILITWGICSMAMALVRTPWEFYLARFLLGLAEAGFFPGVIVYFTHWFPRADRARGLAGMILAVPFSQALGAWLSGEIMSWDWLGLGGWQWVFLVEGLPAVLCGVAVFFFWTDRPRQAKWLTPAEREWLEQTLESERRQSAGIGRVSFGQVLMMPAVWILALGILATNTGGYALGYWLPTAVEELLNEIHFPALAASTVGLMSSPAGDGPLLSATALVAQRPTPAQVLQWLIPYYLLGLIGVWVSGQSSDRFGDRKWHCIAGQVLTGVCLAIAMMPGQGWTWVYTWLCLTGLFVYFWPPPFWVLPTQTLSASAAAVAIGFINICANIAGIIGPAVVGRMKVADYDIRSCLLFAAGCYVLGGVLVAVLRVSPKADAGS